MQVDRNLQIKLKLQLFGCCLRPQQVGDILERLQHIEIFMVDIHLSSTDLAAVQNIVDDVHQQST